MNRAALAFVHDGNGNVLTVSRKTDANDIGLPGGKEEPDMESADVWPHGTLHREVMEETGRVVTHVGRPIYTAIVNEHEVTTFEVTVSDVLAPPTETGVVRWVPAPLLLAKTNSFHAYNRELLEACRKMGGFDGI